MRAEHVQAAFDVIRRQGVPSGAQSTKYDVIDPTRGDAFPPKLVLSLAVGLATGKPLSRAEFTGGEYTNARLRDLGFEIRPKGKRGIAYPIAALHPNKVLTSYDLASTFKVGNAGGMRWSSTHNCLVLVTDHDGGLYDDEWQDEVLHYTGEGQVGDQGLIRQNARLAAQRQTGVAVHYFEIFSPGNYTYAGRMELVGNPYRSTQPDREGKDRQVWMFPLKRADDQPDYNPNRENFESVTRRRRKLLKKLSIEELRKLAAVGARQNPTRRQVTTSQFIRNDALAELTRKLAAGMCDLCRQPAPFGTADGPFLECHHVVPLAEGGPDVLENTVALCPNCHRRSHVLADPRDRLALKKRVQMRDGAEGRQAVPT